MATNDKLPGSSADMIFIYDKDLILVDANEKGLGRFNATREEVIGKSIFELTPDFRGGDRHQIYLDVMRTGNSALFERLIVHPKWGNVTLLLKISKHGDGIKISAEDITEKKNTNGLRWIILHGMERDKVINYILRKDSFYQGMNLDVLSDEQLRSIAFHLDSKLVEERQKRKKNGNENS